MTIPDMRNPSGHATCGHATCACGTCVCVYACMWHVCVHAARATPLEHHAPKVEQRPKVDEKRPKRVTAVRCAHCRQQQVEKLRVLAGRVGTGEREQGAWESERRGRVETRRPACERRV